MPSVQRPCTLNSKNSEGIVDWLTQDTQSTTASAGNLDAPSSSSSASGTSQVTTRPPAATTNTSTTAATLDLSEELFTHQFEEMSDAQPLLPEEVDNRDMSQSGSITHMDVRCDDDDDVVPAAASFAELSNTSEVGDDDDVSVDVTWVPVRREEEQGESSDGETERRRRRRVGSRGRSLQGASGTVRQHVSAPGVSQTARQSTHAVATTRMPSLQSSAVWHFFCVSASDNSDAICNLCQKKLSRGKSNTHLGTTALRRHMISHHKRLWDQHMMSRSSTQTQSHHPPPGPASSATSTTVVLLAPSEPPATPPPTFSSSCSSAHSQVSVKEMFELKKPMSQSHPLARRLTAGLAELLARQLLPYKLVESEAFKKFVAIGTPQWKVPGRNFFSQKAIPNLYKIVEKEVMACLAHSVGARVHLTTDTWSAKHGQGRYITYTAHWVNLLTTAKHGMRGSAEELVTPPRLAGKPAATSSTPPTPSSSITSSAESSSAAASCSTSTAPPQLPRGYSTSRIRQCHAVLGLTCLKAESHTGPALLSALNAQVDQWLTPHQLEIGKVVCDNGSNLLAALNLGKLTHVPCMAHVLNLIVQRFVQKYPGLQDVLKQARKVCGHFRRSYTAMAHFSDIQRRNNMPVRRLICDSPTRWNSTLLMFDRLLQQEKAVNEYLYDRGARTASAELGIFLPRYWMLMRNACRLMRPFEEVTNLVSRTEGTISDIIPFVFFLERALRRVLDQAVDEREEEEEELWSPSPPETALSSSLAGPAATLEEESEEEESEEECGFEGEDDQPQQASQGARCHLSGTRGVVRGWGEEHTFNEISEDEERDMSSSASNLVQMGSFMLSCLLRDPRIKRLKENDLYWVATLLDPRYKQKVDEMLPNYRKSERMQQFQNKLKIMLYTAYKGDVRAQRESNRGRGESNPPPTTPARTGSFTDVLLMEDMRSFLSPTHRRSPSGSTLRERLDRQVADYLALTADIDTLRSDEPLDYWVCRLDLWPELSQFAIELLACPASSVLSERTFSAAGGIVTEKRSRLGQKSLDYLTFIKMNEAWIPKGLTVGDAFD